MSFHEIESGEILDFGNALRIYFEACRAQNEETRQVLLNKKRIRCHFCNGITSLGLREISKDPYVVQAHCEVCEKGWANLKWPSGVR